MIMHLSAPQDIRIYDHIHDQKTENCWAYTGRTIFTWIAASLLDYNLPHSSLTTTQRPSSGSCGTIILSPTLYTTQMTSRGARFRWVLPRLMMIKCCRSAKILGFPIAEEKIDSPAAVITFLGILLDTIKMELRLQKKKLDDLLLLHKQWIRPRIKKTMKRELLSLIGKLSFAAKVVQAGRIFLKRLIDPSTSAKITSPPHPPNSQCQRTDIQWVAGLPPGLERSESHAPG